jgi:hypothetical protein
MQISSSVLFATFRHLNQLETYPKMQCCRGAYDLIDSCDVSKDKAESGTLRGKEKLSTNMLKIENVAFFSPIT